MTWLPCLAKRQTPVSRACPLPTHEQPECAQEIVKHMAWAVINVISMTCMCLQAALASASVIRIFTHTCAK